MSQRCYPTLLLWSWLLKYKSGKCQYYRKCYNFRVRCKHIKQNKIYTIKSHFYSLIQKNIYCVVKIILKKFLLRASQVLGPVPGAGVAAVNVTSGPPEATSADSDLVHPWFSNMEGPDTRMRHEIYPVKALNERCLHQITNNANNPLKILLLLSPKTPPPVAWLCGLKRILI